ncbi:hypothetical protein HMPREF6485_0771 [Segatella buccae ATCC 33574]|uniref:Uncharacterized protein n=1 Tax=Segatella buccae ATCC 33574 TaxID=873513 RepID=E6K553_9BACT|nr:hypothetical protein HMPREF6485_0771 [Segatella buccae ATCC 33574]
MRECCRGYIFTSGPACTRLAQSHNRAAPAIFATFYFAIMAELLTFA